MSEHGFTPGPWTLTPASYGYDLCVRGIVSDTSGGWFVQLHSGERDNDPPEFRQEFDANARLIAAAPELLEAAPDAADMLERYADFIRRDVKADDLERHPYLPELERIAAAMRAAITKATTN